MSSSVLNTNNNKEKNKSTLFKGDFKYLFWGQLVSNFGDNLFLPTILWIATELSSSPFEISLINVFDTLPGLILGIFIGSIIDNLDKRKAMILSDMIRAVLICTIIWCYLTNSLKMSHVYIVTFFIALFTRVYSPSQLSIIPNIVENDDIQKANSYLNMSNNIMIFAGNSISGFIFGIFGAAISMAINAFSFVFSGGCIYLIKGFDKQNKSNGLTFKKVLIDTIDGLRYLRKQTMLIIYLLMSLIINLALGSLILMPLFIKNSLISSMSAYGLIEGFSALGMVGTSWLLTNYTINKPFFYMSTSIVVIGVCFVCMSIFNSIWILGVSRFIMGIMLSLFNITFITQFQKNIDSNFRGRVFTISYLASTILFPISSVISGFFANIIGIKIVWVIMGLLIILITLPLFNYGIKKLKFEGENG